MVRMRNSIPFATEGLYRPPPGMKIR